jgi:parallel beta-helix repeat protein
MKYSVLVLVSLSAASVLAEEAPPVRQVTANVTLEKGAVIRTPLVIAADNLVIDGNGATLQGPGEPGKLKTFIGAGISARGRSNIVIRNLKVKGFESGLVADNGKAWIIEDCDFSDNYHDPDYGWGDYKRVGGIIFTGMSGCTIRRNKANRVWNGLDLWESNENIIEGNDFSHCSNVCLKLWRACANKVVDNNLSYGLRISPGEVHARDSTSVLIETGSDNNRFERNDVTHGGDGIFIRVLNGWCSRGNVFIENDCSYANNNGFEAWSPDNTYIRNKSNHCSYGFWLGGSDHTVLIGNEAAFNGRPDGFHNAPEPDFIHGGIVIVGGSGTHTLIDGNYCHDNNGAGIVFRGDLGTKGKKWKMYHLVVQNNRIENNKWGLFARFTDWLDLSNNQYKGNEKEELLEDVAHLSRREPDPQHKEAPKAVIAGPSRAAVGQQVSFDASGSKDPAGRPLQFRWEVGGKEYTGPKVTHTFDAPGFYRVGVTATNGYLAGLAFIDFYAAQPVNEPATLDTPGGRSPRAEGPTLRVPGVSRVEGSRASHCVAANSRSARSGTSNRKWPVHWSSASSSSVRRSINSVPRPASCKTEATARFRGLCRPLPLPCAKRTTAVAPAGRTRSPSSLTGPAGI